MKVRLIQEPRESGQFLYSTEEQLPSGTWVYVAGTCSRDLTEATALFEIIRLRGPPGKATVLREAATYTPKEIAEFIAEEDRINGDAA